MKPLDMKAVNKLHKEKFGVEPVITGIEFFNPKPLIQRVLESIEANKPYVEDEVPDGVDI
ncbi:hypothetical protein KAH27_04310 [bacterium]|nr:hypothetical protein [bacterium]